MEPYDAIAAYYDLEHDGFDDDVELYRQMLYEGPILEVGAGTGRVAVPLAQEGIEVWGVDVSEAMLDRARERAGDAPALYLIHGDVRHLNLERRFRAAILPLNALWHLRDIDAQLEGLGAIARHLEPGARIIIDTSNPHTMDDRGASGSIRVRFHGNVSGDRVTGYSAAWDDEAQQMLTLDLWYDRLEPDGRVRRESARLELRYLYRHELELLMRLAGFQPEHVYGSYALDPYETVSERLLFTARRP